MKRKRLLPLFLFFSLLLSAPVSAEVLTYIGKAYDAESGELIYTENHEETREAGVPTVHGVEYRAPDGSLIASKTIDYRKSRTYPDFRMEDVRDGYLEGGELDGERYRLYVRKKTGEKRKEDDFEIPDDFVADAGFNQFMRSEWKQLVSGETVTIHFAAPPQLDFFRFRAKLTERKTFLGRKAGVFRIDVDNALIRLFVDPIVLTYDLDTMELLEFAGMANVNDEAGKSHVARIVFEEGQGAPAGT